MLTLVIVILFVLQLITSNKLSALEGRINLLEGKQSQPKSADVRPAVQTQAAASADVIPEAAATHVHVDVKPSAPVYQPSSLDRQLASLSARLLTGNPIAKIGMLILFIGMAFLLRYTAQRNLISLEWRLLGVSGVGIGMLLLGWRLSLTRRLYGNIISGGGVGILYLTVFTALQFYHVIEPVTAFALLVCIAMLSGVIALAQDARYLAVFGIVGGFLAPILVSNNSGNYVALFSYYAILNLFILAVAWFKSWRELNLIGFIFTFLVSAMWGWTAYQEAYRWTAEGFLIYFFLFYVAVTLVVTWRKIDEVKGFVGMALLLGTPMSAFGLQIGLMRSIPYALAASALALCAFYTGAYSLIETSPLRRLQVLQKPFAVIALLFGTITLPLALSDTWTAMSWALESILVLWFGIQRSSLLTRLFAGLLLIASVVFFLNDSLLYVPAARFVNELYLCGVFISIASIVDAYYFYFVPVLVGKYSAASRDEELLEKLFAFLFFIGGMVGWYLLNLRQISLFIPDYYGVSFILLLTTVTSLIVFMLSTYLNWTWLSRTSLLLLPVLYGFAFEDNSILYVSLTGLLAWYFILYRHDHKPASYLPVCHFFTFIFVVLFITDQLIKLLPGADVSMLRYLIKGSIPAFMLYVACYADKVLPWPLVRYQSSYQQWGGALLFAYLILWLIESNQRSGDIASLMYIPLINPLDVTIAFVIVTMMAWLEISRSWLGSIFRKDFYKMILAGLYLLGFVCLNAVLCRSLHHWAGIPYNLAYMWRLMMVQACLSMLWTVVALILTFVAARIKNRALWFAGFGLILIVIVKLFMIDLHNTNAIGQILTFIGVGILLLVNGYISPLPPKR